MYENAQGIRGRKMLTHRATGRLILGFRPSAGGRDRWHLYRKPLHLSGPPQASCGDWEPRGHWKDGLMAGQARRSRLSLRFLIRRGAGGPRDFRSPPVTHSPAPHLGLVSCSLGIPSLALPLLCWSPRSRARRISGGGGEVSNARPKGFPVVGVGQPCGFSGCPESVPCWDLLPTLSGSHLVSKGTNLWRDQTGSSLNPTQLAKQTPTHPPSSRRSQKVAAMEPQE